MNDYINVSNLQSNLTPKSFNICINEHGEKIEDVLKAIDKVFQPLPVYKKFNAIYCYSLREGTFSYPNGESNVLYIGSTAGESNGGKRKMSFRFKHCMSGKDKKINECLKFYYSQGTKLMLEIYDLPATKSGKECEKRLRTMFLQKFAAMPIADGASIK